MHAPVIYIPAPIHMFLPTMVRKNYGQKTTFFPISSMSTILLTSSYDFATSCIFLIKRGYHGGNAGQDEGVIAIASRDPTKKY